MKTLEMVFYSLTHYNNPYDLFSEEGYEMTEDQADYFRHIVDFEPVVFYLVNGLVVVTCDSINGDVLGQEKLSDYYRHSIEAYEEGKID